MNKKLLQITAKVFSLGELQRRIEGNPRIVWYTLQPPERPAYDDWQKWLKSDRRASRPITNEPNQQAGFKSFLLPSYY